MSQLSDITIAIPTFLRNGYCVACIKAVQEYLPECQVIVADDGDAHGTFRHKWKGFKYSGIQLPFDSGLSIKRNAIVKACETSLVLMFCDDFKADEECRAGVLRMLEVLDQWPSIAVAAGRVDKRPYEATLEYVSGSHIRETRVDVGRAANEQLTCNGRPSWLPVDLAVNYFLARTAMMRDCPWPEDIRPIGGEHVAFYLDAKMKGYTTVFVHGVNVRTMTLGPDAQDPRYPAMRARAYATGHAAMKKHYNIDKFIGMAGDVS